MGSNRLTKTTFNANSSHTASTLKSEISTAKITGLESTLFLEV